MKKSGIIFQEYRIKHNLTQEQLAEILSKSVKTISQIETARNGTSKKTDIDIMNFLEISPNTLYKNFITNENLKKKIFVSEKLEDMEYNELEVVLKIIDAIKSLR